MILSPFLQVRKCSWPLIALDSSSRESCNWSYLKKECCQYCTHRDFPHPCEQHSLCNDFIRHFKECKNESIWDDAPRLWASASPFYIKNFICRPLFEKPSGSYYLCIFNLRESFPCSGSSPKYPQQEPGIQCRPSLWGQNSSPWATTASQGL